jgi:hypothetical protein
VALANFAGKWVCERCSEPYTTEEVKLLRLVGNRFPKCDKPTGEVYHTNDKPVQALCGGTVWQPLEVNHG